MLLRSKLFPNFRPGICLEKSKPKARSIPLRRIGHNDVKSCNHPSFRMPSQSLRQLKSYRVVSYRTMHRPLSSSSSSSSFSILRHHIPRSPHKIERDKYVLLAGLAQMGRHLDVVVVEMFVGCCRDLFNKSSSLQQSKIEVGLLRVR